MADYKRHVEEWKRDVRFGSVLGFWGQEHLYEDWSDQRLTDRALEACARRLGLRDPRSTGVVHLDFHRNSAATDQVYLCEPGIDEFRPSVDTPLRNLKLAGDWVRNEVDLLCMEGALDAGQVAARAALRVARGHRVGA